MKIENVQVYDLEESIKASKYPMAVDTDSVTSEITSRTHSLAASPKGEGHDQFLTGIRVNFDLTCSNKMWVEAERYRFLEFVSSQSTMHRITKFDLSKQYNEYVDPRVVDIMKEKVQDYNKAAEEYENSLKYGEKLDIFAYENRKKQKYLEILYTNPAGFELTARMTTNYRALKTIYSQRKNHRLPEWRKFCKWIETLPYADTLICGAAATQKM